MLRGLVMVLMALDHTRDFFSDALYSPTDLGKTNVWLFITRWVTHICAPTFVFLTGSSAYLSTVRRNLTKPQLASYLFTRGLWLVALELTLVRFGWLFNWGYDVIFGQVIWALGWSMVALSGLVFLPRWVIAGFALATIAGHNSLDSLRPADFGGLAWLWTVLHVPGKIELVSGHRFYVDYPLIPWVGVMAAGYSFGTVFLQPTSSRKATLLRLGSIFAAMFLLLRLSNLYGDPEPWQAQHNPLFTVFAVLNCEKYPPSLAYLLMTISIMMFLLALFEWRNLGMVREPLLIFGRVPLFFYLLHLPLIHCAALAITYFRGLPVDWLLGRGRHAFPTMPSPEYGYNLPTVYAIWVAMLLLLYPVCKLFARYKLHHPELRWLSYI